MMNRHVSTYQKDYISPQASAACRPKLPTMTFKSCTDSRQALKELADVGDCFDSSPAGWLSEPKIYPAETRPRIQEVEVTPSDQPRGCAKTVSVENCVFRLFSIVENNLCASFYLIFFFAARNTMSRDSRNVGKGMVG